MTALLLFGASFLVVFALGFQQLNVTAGYVRLAIATSVLINAGTLLQFKVLPGPTSVLEVVAYFAGSAAGIVASMKAHPIAVRKLQRWRLLFDRRRIARAIARDLRSNLAAPAAHHQEIDPHDH
jgi:hypothetical protein